MKDHRRLLLAAVVLGVLLPVAVSPAQEEPAVVTEEYRLVVGDQIEVVVEKYDIGKSYTVPVEGEVAFPPIGKIRLLDKSLKEISEEIELKLKEKGQYTDPQVYVLLTAYAPRQAFLWGAATGAVPLLPHKKLTLLQVLSTAKVEPTVADFRDIKVIRKSPSGKPFPIPVNLQDVVARNRFDADIVVMPDDIIYVPSFQDLTQTAWVYILGKVNKPGRYGFIPGREKMKLTSLVALAGDFHQFADEGRIKILRQQRSGTQLIPLDFDDIIDLTIEDPPLEADDLVYVPESFF